MRRSKNNFGTGHKAGGIDASDERAPLKKSLPTPANLVLLPDSSVSLSKLHATAVAQQRRETLRRFEALSKRHPKYKAASIAGASTTNLWRWRKAYAKRGLAGLRPNYSKCGRRSPFADLRLTAAAVRALELLHVEHTPSQAWKNFADSPYCPPVVALCVRRMNRPPSLLAGVGRVNLVMARVYASADGSRLYVKLPARATITTKLTLPGIFKLQVMAA